MIPKNAINLTLQMNAGSDEELIDQLNELVAHFHIYGVRSFVASDLGIVEIERRDVTPEQYRQEVHEAATEIKRKRKEDAA